MEKQEIVYPDLVSPTRKAIQAMFALTFTCASAYGAYVYMLKRGHVATLQTQYETNETCVSLGSSNNCADITVYDLNWLPGPFSDSSEATRLKAYYDSYDQTTRLEGSRWSSIYTWCMINFMLLAFQGFLETFGVVAFMWRMWANTCVTCCSCVNAYTIVLAACYRYNLRGRLAALS